MTRVFGTLFEDGRNGLLAIKPSQPFFGCDRHEKHFPVLAGEIDIELPPTPAGVFFNVGFKEEGDTRRTDFTLRWRIPSQQELDITAKPEQPRAERSSSVIDRVQVRRLTTELADALEAVEKLERDLAQSKAREESLAASFEQHKAATDHAFQLRDSELSRLTEANKPRVQTVVKHVPVPPKQLNDRIKFLEAENLRLIALNDTYYASVLELHQLKLDRAQTVHLPNPVTEMPGSTQQRLINKLLAK